MATIAAATFFFLFAGLIALGAVFAGKGLKSPNWPVRRSDAARAQLAEQRAIYEEAKARFAPFQKTYFRALNALNRDQ